jgi:hypothetical protein
MELNNSLIGRDLVNLVINSPSSSPADKLEAFSQSERCKYLLNNPKRIGYKPARRWLLEFLLPMFAGFVCLILTLTTNSRFLPPEITILLLIVFLIVLFYFYRIAWPKVFEAVKTWKRKGPSAELKIFDIICEPVWVLSVDLRIKQEEKKLIEINLIVLENDVQERFEVIQWKEETNFIVKANDVGVAYLTQSSAKRKMVIHDFAR